MLREVFFQKMLYDSDSRANPAFQSAPRLIAFSLIVEHQDGYIVFWMNHQYNLCDKSKEFSNWRIINEKIVRFWFQSMSEDNLWKSFFMTRRGQHTQTDELRGSWVDIILYYQNFPFSWNKKQGENEKTGFGRLKVKWVSKNWIIC